MDQKSIKKRSENEANIGGALVIDFESILVDIGRLVGTENPIRSNQIQVRSGQIMSDQVRTYKSYRLVLMTNIDMGFAPRTFRPLRANE